LRTVEPSQVGEIIREVAQDLQQSGQKIGPAAARYVEKRNGFECATCTFVTPVNATHGRCALVETMVHLQDGLCVLWEPDPKQLHLYKEASDL